MKKPNKTWKSPLDIKVTVTGALQDQRPVSAKTLKRIEKSMKKFFGKPKSV